jgi:hypothetical protein
MVKAGESPWIGLPAQMDPGSDKYYLGRNYSDAVVALGGIPLVIPMRFACHCQRSRWSYRVRFRPGQ